MAEPTGWESGRVTIERFRDGWVLVDRDGVISTPAPMTEDNARAFADLLGIDWPEDDVTP